MDGIEVDRAGTRYGPYTPEEFLAYLASGHIVAGDRARIGQRGGFEPVPVIAARIAGRPPSAEPAVAPSARPGDVVHPGATAPPEPASAEPAPAESAPPDPAPAESAAGPPPAGFWRRAGAYAIDLGIVLVAWTVLSLGGSLLVIAAGTVAVNGGMDASATRQAIGFASTVLLLAAWAFYCAWQESSPARATFGKRLMGLVVVDREGARLSLQRALGRHVAALLNWITLAIGWLLAAVPPAKRGLHDHLAGTRVVGDGARAVSPWIGAATFLVVMLVLLAGRIALQRGVVLPF